MELIATSHGNVGCELVDEDAAGPLLLVLPGLGPPTGIRQVLPASTAVAAFGLPAFGGPTLSSYLPGAISGAFDEALAARFPGRSVIILAVSLGAAIALGMRSAQISGIVAIEPFLSSDRAILHEMAASRFLPHRPDLVGLFRGVIGYQGEPLSYPILSQAPLTVLVGDNSDVPNAGSIPSLCDERDRETFRTKGARVIVARGRHDLLASDPEAVRLAVQRLLVGYEDNSDATIAARASDGR